MHHKTLIVVVVVVLVAYAAVTAWGTLETQHANDANRVLVHRLAADEARLAAQQAQLAAQQALIERARVEGCEQQNRKWASLHGFFLTVPPPPNQTAQDITLRDELISILTPNSCAKGAR